MQMTQAIILITGAIAIWLSQCSGLAARRWACLVGLAGQPFWLVSTWDSGQWGMLALSVFYTVAWLNGVRVYWWRDLTSTPN